MEIDLCTWEVEIHKHSLLHQLLFLQKRSLNLATLLLRLLFRL
jgi:hypothetical protein